ncbi:MAG: HlyD family efflux transporter periplasmic adaptor subunit [Chloroflexi bacterium]|nr:MAG: HlyD family efflux transporter periplasmic adaptor subunit [Chloroflexota bacterium]
MTQSTQIPEEQVLSLPDFSAIAPDEQESTFPPSPRPPWRRRRRIITIILVVLLILAGILAYFLIRGRQRPITYQFQQAIQGNFSLTVSATGPLQSAVYNLVFTGTGTISEIDVSVGQTVTKGQVLAKLNKTSLQDAVNTAQAGVLSAQTGMNTAQANLSKAQAQSNANVQSAQVALNNAQASLSTTQTQSQASISAAQTTLSNDQTNLSHTQTQSAASISLAQTTLSNAQTSLSHTQATASAQIAAAQLAKEQACTATPPAPDCATATAAYNQTVAAANANVAAAQANVTSAQKQLTLTEAQANANNATAQARVTSDQKQVASSVAQASSNNTTAQNTVNAATSALATAQANAAASVTSQQGMVNTAQRQLQTALVTLHTAQHNLANATLLAPHEGIVTTINGTVGGTPGAPASASTTSTSGGTFIQIADISTLQVLAAVNESDTANLKVGDPAQFTVSAYGNRLFTGTVSAISPIGQTVSNVVSYPVTIDVKKDDLQNANLLPGMTASVTIVVVQRPNVVLIPVNAINFARTATGTVNGIPPLITTQLASAALAQARQMRTELLNQNPAVAQDNPIPAYVLEQPAGRTAFITVPVVLGLTDDTYYEVLKGLSPGDIIVVGAQRG